MAPTCDQWFQRPVRPQMGQLKQYVHTQNHCMMHPPQNPEVRERLMQAIAECGIRLEPRKPAKLTVRPLRPHKENQPECKSSLLRAGTAVAGGNSRTQRRGAPRRRALSEPSLALGGRALGEARDASAFGLGSPHWRPKPRVPTETQFNSALGQLRARAKNHRVTAATKHRVASDVDVWGGQVLEGAPADCSWDSYAAQLAVFHNGAMRSKRPSGMEQHRLPDAMLGSPCSGSSRSSSLPLVCSPRTSGETCGRAAAARKTKHMMYESDRALRQLREMKTRFCPKQLELDERLQKARAVKEELGAVFEMCMEHHAREAQWLATPRESLTEDAASCGGSSTGRSHRGRDF